MNALKTETGSSCIFITHDLGVISEMADRVVVMYGGKVCETAPTDELFEQTAHPYTLGLIHSRPKADFDGDRLEVIPGNVPSLNDKPEGCPFHPRCCYADEKCKKEFPPATELSDVYKRQGLQIIKRNIGAGLLCQILNFLVNGKPLFFIRGGGALFKQGLDFAV